MIDIKPGQFSLEAAIALATRFSADIGAEVDEAAARAAYTAFTGKEKRFEYAAAGYRLVVLQCGKHQIEVICAGAPDPANDNKLRRKIANDLIAYFRNA